MKGTGVLEDNQLQKKYICLKGVPLSNKFFHVKLRNVLSR